MSSALHVIAEQGSGRLGIVAHPRGDAWPAERLTELAGRGVSVLVSALTTAELRDMGLAGTTEAAAEAGIDFVAYPTADVGVPRDEATKVILLSGRLAANIRAGRFVATQCYGGVGRSTLLACTTLVLLGHPPSDALRRVTGGSAAPVTRDWLYELAHSGAVPL